MDNQRSEKIMEEYREEVSDLRRQSYPKMSLNEAVKIASEYMLNHYSKEELKEAIINDKQMQLFGMEKSWLNALGKAKKMAKGSTIDGGGYDIVGGARTVYELSVPELETQLHITKSSETERIKLIKKLIEEKSDKYANGSTVKGGEIRRFDRHANMGGETRGQILDYTNYPIIYNDMDKYERINEALKKEGFSKSRFSNYLYGLFDGYDYSDTDSFKEQMAIIKKVDPDFYKKISSIYEEIKSYPEVKYADGGGLEDWRKNTTQGIAYPKVGESFNVVDSGWIQYGTNSFITLENAKKELEVERKQMPLNAEVVIVEDGGQYYIFYRRADYGRRGNFVKRVYANGGNMSSGFNYSIGGL
jgi:hypothetical protein